MREILFRGRTKADKKWIYGNLLWTDDGIYIIQNYVPEHLLEKYEVDEATVCQFTGTEDKVVKIFEGDILSFTQKGQKSNGVVKMVDGCFFAIIEGQRCWLSEGVKRYKGKVIGNIFDNPELMQEI